MKAKTLATLGMLMVIITLLSLTGSATAAVLLSDRVPSPLVAPVPSATGIGWYVQHSQRDGFSFFILRGAPKPDGWRYFPRGQVTFVGKSFNNSRRTIQVWSAMAWRWRIDKIDGGNRTVIAGIATVKIGEELRTNWWFRVTARDVDDANKGKDAFMIQLWRPIGARNVGGWSARVFNASKPASLHLNQTAFYESKGVLRSGNIEINI